MRSGCRRFVVMAGLVGCAWATGCAQGESRAGTAADEQALGDAPPEAEPALDHPVSTAPAAKVDPASGPTASAPTTNDRPDDPAANAPTTDTPEAPNPEQAAKRRDARQAANPPNRGLEAVLVDPTSALAAHEEEMIHCAPPSLLEGATPIGKPEAIDEPERR